MAIVDQNEADTAPRGAGRPEDAPRYRLLQPWYDGAQIVDEGEEVVITDEPGEHLEPINAAAKRRVREWREKVGNGGSTSDVSGMLAADKRNTTADANDVASLKAQVEVLTKLVAAQGKQAD
jgi:hypothetical protein